MTTDTTPAAIEALIDDRVQPLLLLQAKKRGAFDWNYGDVEPVIAELLARLDALAAERDAALTEAAALRKEVERLRHIVTEQGQTMAQRLSRAEASELREAAMRKEVEQLREAFSDPIAVHANMLRGAIAMPSVENIMHAYGAEALRAALARMKEAGE